MNANIVRVFAQAHLVCNLEHVDFTLFGEPRDKLHVPRYARKDERRADPLHNHSDQ